MLLDTSAAVRLAAMNLLARREHGHVELARKLRKAGADEALIEPVLARLAEDGLLDESRYLEAYIASRARAGHGPLRIREELRQRGLPADKVAEALEACGQDWDAALTEVWRKKFGTLPDDAREHARQARFLAYRGYVQDRIGKLLRGRLDV